VFDQRNGSGLSVDQAAVATGLASEVGRRRAIESLMSNGDVQVEGDQVVEVKGRQTPRGRPTREQQLYDSRGHPKGKATRLSSPGSRRFRNSNPNYSKRNGQVLTRPLNGRELAALTDDEVAERLSLGRQFEVSEITDGGDVRPLGYAVVAPEPEEWDG